MIKPLLLVIVLAALIAPNAQAQFTFSTSASAETVECCNALNTSVMMHFSWEHSPPPAGLRGSLMGWTWSRSLACVGGNGTVVDNGIRVISNNDNERDGMFSSRIQCPFGLKTFAQFAILGTAQFPNGFYAADSSTCRTPCNGSHCVIGVE